MLIGACGADMARRAENRVVEIWKLRGIANWANQSTPFGLGVARLGGAAVEKGPGDLRLAGGYHLRLPAAAAFTVGSVVITRHPVDWLTRHERLLLHEERHSWQYAALGGLPLIPVYLLATVYSQWKVGDRGAANVFERLAGLEDGGYRVPSRDDVRAVKHARRRRRRKLLDWGVRSVASAGCRESRCGR